LYIGVVPIHDRKIPRLAFADGYGKITACRYSLLLKENEAMAIVTQNILFIGGKGGVGKSTTAAAIAWRHAQKGCRTLVVSTDPAHNLGDIFNKTIGGSITEVADNLHALEIDPEKETVQYIERVKETIHGIVHSEMMEEVHRQLDT